VKTNTGKDGGSIAQQLAYKLPVPDALGSLPGVPKNYLRPLRLIDSTDVMISGGQQRLDKIDRTHLLLVASTTNIRNKLVMMRVVVIFNGLIVEKEQ
jgi:hypothetical protein